MKGEAYARCGTANALDDRSKSLAFTIFVFRDYMPNEMWAIGD